MSQILLDMLRVSKLCIICHECDSQLPLTDPYLSLNRLVITITAPATYMSYEGKAMKQKFSNSCFTRN